MMNIMKIFIVLLALLSTFARADNCNRFDLDTDTFDIDTAAIRIKVVVYSPSIIQNLNSSVTPFISRSDCHNCKFLPLFWDKHYDQPGNITIGQVPSYYCTTTSNFEWQLQIFNTSALVHGVEQELGYFSEKLGANGAYTLTITIDDGMNFQYDLVTDKSSENPYIAMAIVFPVAIVVVALSWLLTHKRVQNALKRARHYIVRDRSGNEVVGADEQAQYGLLDERPVDELAEPVNRTIDQSDDQSNEADVLVKRVDGKQRLLSLDSFRGLSLAIMIFVNQGGGDYWFFNHSEWDGLTVADLVFPWFIWMMGNSMAISFNSMNKKGVTRGEQVLKVLRRAAVLFFLGLLVSNGSTPFTHLRIMGVLQRFSTSYLIVSLIIIFVPKLEYESQSKPWLGEIVPYLFEFATVLGITILHSILTFTVHAPGCPPGYLGPGGLADQGRYAHCTGGAAKVLDEQILGINHVYGGPTCRTPYQCEAYDPEGLLGILTSSVMCYLGVIAGRVVVHNNTHQARLKRWAIGCLICGIIALGLCGGTQYDGVIPVNKNLWSLSFIMAMSCFAYFNLSWMYTLIDVVKLWHGAPFRQLGQNSILIYVFSETIGSSAWPFMYQIDGPDTHLSRLTHDTIVVGMHALIAVYAAAVGFFINI